jgi:mannan polymerase II complex MNN10 subunit
MLRTSNKLNAGSFLVKSNEWSLKFLDGTRSMYDEKEVKGEHTPHDQEAMVQLMKAEPALLGNVKYIPQWKMNAYPEEIGCYDEDKRKWEPGMLMIHFAGAWAHVKEEDPTGYLMKKYGKQIEWGTLPPGQEP